MYGTFQFKPASATRRNLPNRVMTATWAVFTVKKLPRIKVSAIMPTITRKMAASVSIQTLRRLSLKHGRLYKAAGDGALKNCMGSHGGKNFSARVRNPA